MKSELDSLCEQDIAIINACIVQERKQGRMLVMGAILALIFIIGGCFATVKIIQGAHKAQLEAVKAYKAMIADKARAGAGVSIMQDGTQTLLIFSCP